MITEQELFDKLLQVQSNMSNFIIENDKKINSINDNFIDTTENINKLSEKINDLNELQDKITNISNKVYPLYDQKIITKTLEDTYNDLKNNLSSLEGMAAVGMKILLDKSQIIYKNSNNQMFYYDGKNYNEIYSNFEVILEENQEEIAIIWYFNKQIDLNNVPDYSILELYIKDAGNCNLHESYYRLAHKINTDGPLNMQHDFCEKEVMRGNNKIDSSMRMINPNLRKFKSYTTSTNGGTNSSAVPFYNLSYLDKIEFPYLVSFSGGCIVKNCPKLNIKKEDFPKLKAIGDGTSYSSNSYCVFDGINSVEIPESVTSLGKYIFLDINSVSLYCNKAQIDPNIIGNSYYVVSWSEERAPQNLYLSNDWQATINLSILGAKQSIEWYIDLLTNKLAEVEYESITLPRYILDSLEGYEEGQQAIEIAINKGWSIGG